MFLFRDYKLEGNKEVRNAIMAISSVGWHKAFLICYKCGLSYPLLLKNLTLYLWKLIFFILSRITCNSAALKRLIRDQLLHITSLDTYRSQRHLAFLPVRGQRSRNNAGTQKALGKKYKRNLELIWSQ